MTEPKKRNSTSLMLLLLYALLIASLLVFTLAGARLYSDTMDARDAHAKQRSAPARLKQVSANWSWCSTKRKWRCWRGTVPGGDQGETHTN